LTFYLQHDGYPGSGKALKEMTPETIIEEGRNTSLRGRGGADFPRGMKWSFVQMGFSEAEIRDLQRGRIGAGDLQGPAADEMDPHQMIEGMVIAGRAIGSHQGFIYIRGEYRYVLDIVDSAIAEAYARAIWGRNILGSGFDFDLLIHTARMRHDREEPR